MAMTMTELEARKFDRFSEQNYEVVKEQLECGCEPYVDVFTLKRWNAQGFKVKKGEKSIRITTIVKKEVKDKKTGEKETKQFPKTAFVFCRCQVEKFEEKGGAR
jgi:mannose-6-phosphate isomerase class I